MKRVFVCSPYSGNIGLNVERAKELCRLAVLFGNAPFAPHLHYTHFLTENSHDRNAGIDCGLSFLETCDEVWVDLENSTSDLSTKGMAVELQVARRLGIPIVFVGSLRTNNKEKK